MPAITNLRKYGASGWQWEQGKTRYRTDNYGKGLYQKAPIGWNWMRKKGQLTGTKQAVSEKVKKGNW